MRRTRLQARRPATAGAGRLARLALVALLVLPGLPAAARQGEAGPPSLGVDQTALIGEPHGEPLTGAELDRATEELSSIMRCPVCQALSVADSPTLSAKAMKAEVRQFLAAGYTRDQILTYFEQSYGEFIRLQPRATGFNLLVWVAPALGLILGAGVIAFYLRSAPRPAVVARREEGADLSEYRDRVRREVEG